MKIVIDIPEEEYNYYRDDSNFWGYSKLREIILNGTPLPKGHGRIIDESEITSFYYHEETAKSKNSGAITLTWNVIDGTDAPTIIESDKEDK